MRIRVRKKTDKKEIRESQGRRRLSVVKLAFSPKLSIQEEVHLRGTWILK